LQNVKHFFELFALFGMNCAVTPALIFDPLFVCEDKKLELA